MNELSSEPSMHPEATERSFSDAEACAVRLSDTKEDLESQENSEATIRRVLSSYDIGQKIRQLRLRKKIALVDLGKHTGLSASMISQLENGKLIPTLGTLARIAMVFDLGLDYFFVERKRRRPFLVVRSVDRMKFPDRPTSPRPDYFFECLAFSAQEKSMQAYQAEFPRRTSTEVTEHFHEGAEFFHVLEGSVVIRYGGEDHTLEAGDSVYFDAAEPHSYRGTSRQPAKAMVVVSSPRL